MSERKFGEGAQPSPVLTRRRLVLSGSLLGGALVVGMRRRTLGPSPPAR